MSPKIVYQKKDSILSIRFRKEKSVDSDIQGNVVIDYDKNGNIVNIDIMDIDLNKLVGVKERQRLSIASR